QHRQELGHDENAVAIPSVDEHPGERSENQRRDLTEETDYAKQKDGSAQSVDKPAGGNACDPGANERDRLAAEEEPVVPVLKRASEMRRTAGTLVRLAGCMC